MLDLNILFYIFTFYMDKVVNDKIIIIICIEIHAYFLKFDDS